MPGAPKIPAVAVDSLSSVAEVEAALAAASVAEVDVEERLEKLLSRSGAETSARATALARAAQRAAAVSDDAEELASILDSAARTAQSVSARVRVLDAIVTRGADALARVEDVLTLRVCAEGAKTSLSAADLPGAAKHVERYLQLDAAVREDQSSAAAVGQIVQSIDELSRKVRTQADSVLSESDPASPLDRVISAVRLFVPIGLRDEGLTRLSDYLKSQIARESDADIRSLLIGSKSSDESASGVDEPHVVALARLFEAVAGYLHDCEETVPELFGPGALVQLAVALQSQCDVHSNKILLRYMESRRLDEVARALRSETANARDLDALLNELTLVSQRMAAYFEFLRQRCPEDETFLDCLRQAKLSQWVSELSMRYVAMEAYFMRENARLAIRIDENGGENAETSTAVDDFFFVMQKCLQRAMAYGDTDADSLSAVLQHVNGCLSNDLLSYIRRRLRETETALEKMLRGSTSAGSLPTAALTVSYLAELAKANISKAGGGEQTGAEDVAKYDFFVALNNASVSAAYAMRFRTNVEKAVAASPKLSVADRNRLSGPLALVSDASRALVQAGEQGTARLTAVLTTRVASRIDTALASASFMVSDTAYSLDTDSSSSFSRETTEEIEAKVLSPLLEKRLTEENWDALVRLVAEWTASKIESTIFLPPVGGSVRPKQFNALGGLRADRDVRALSAFFSGKSRRSTVRDVFARLSQLAMLVNLERPAEIYDIWGPNAGGMTWRLAAAEVRRALLLRADFKPDAVRALKL